jgi:proteasome accessory factor B
MIFDYVDADLTVNSRKIVPISLSTRSGFWYVAGVDQDVEEIRTFRLDRISGDIEVSKGPEDFEAPEGFNPKEMITGINPHGVAIIDVRKGKASTLRSLATSVQSLGEWDQLKIPIFNLESLTSLVLWHGLDAIVKEPESLQSNVILHLEALVHNHD